MQDIAEKGVFLQDISIKQYKINNIKMLIQVDTIRFGVVQLFMSLKTKFDNNRLWQTVYIFFFHSGIGIGFCRTKQGCSGAGHGGTGGQGYNENKAGVAFDSFLAPTEFGKNGGHSSFPHLGGLGAGRLKLEVLHFLTVDGTLSADGGDWRSVRAGGGSGGSVWLETHTIDGTGYIQALGGAGYHGNVAEGGGGGAGGRIALYYVKNNFLGKSILWRGDR